jgi:hypothetical protein
MLAMGNTNDTPSPSPTSEPSKPTPNSLAGKPAPSALTPKPAPILKNDRPPLHKPAYLLAQEEEEESIDKGSII